MRILSCLSGEHDLSLVALAVITCVSGSWIALEIFRRACQRSGRQRLGWIFIAAVAAGCVVWCTHFVAMLAYRDEVPATYDPLLTVISLLLVIGGIALAFHLAPEHDLRRHLPAWLIAGLVLGGSVSAMHYVGMMAYQVRGLLIWDPPYVVASVVLAVLFALLALGAVAGGRRRLAFAGFVLCIVSLHFTGMAALALVPFGDVRAGSSGAGELAVALACGAMLVATTGAVSRMIDSDANEQAVDALRHMALVDSLTNLPNRNSFTSFLELELARERAMGRSFAVVVIDFDKFKAVNDVHGHEGGDTLLREVAARMRAVLRSGEFLARMGGDEFAAICPLPDGRRGEDFIRRLEMALDAPVRIKEFDVMPEASFGVSIFPQDGDSGPQILGNADLAMYRAKQDPARGVSYYEPGMDEAARARRELVLELRRALERHEFDLHYQVQTSLGATGPRAAGCRLDYEFGPTEILGYEALLRWRHPVRGQVAPVEFIPLAEESGLIIPIGEWVLRKACRDAAAWRQPHCVAVNISALQITHGDLPRLVAQVLEETGLAPQRLELEVTETLIIEDREKCLAALTAIRALGVTVALDDFGTGYSSLDTLRAFPFNRIKLDRSFMRDIAASPEALAILRAVLALGRSLDMRVLAEGVETIEQLCLLQAEDCREAQGYLFGRPAPLQAKADDTPAEPAGLTLPPLS
ncbi:EAL domain-containing protein [Starkeya koreensis]|uniref:EAL domain-containing protein n=1 Tax=Ancylobacter koreensis TaxID=266121 RepID=A0ABT0DQ50_9HYPH|nr:EAL domain-containing protein [Ancylobacter koreensis]MCK0209412.1 EAL domain-containing protein [Ancylobacter koreensis]